jgi:hypothetical protein
MSEDHNYDQDNLIKNRDLVEYPTNLDQLNKWTIPSVSPKQIYSFGRFDILSRMAVKTIEQNIQVSDENKEINLIREKDLKSYKNYNYIHIGLIQVAFKPLTLLGLNASLMAYVRDGRSKDFKSSLAALIETSLCHRPVYFDIFPNITLSMTDKNLYDAMQLKIHTSGYNFKPGSEIMAICYRVHYKVLNTLNPRVKTDNISFPGKTTLVQTNLLTSYITTNRMIRWDEITFPETWDLQQEVEPEPILNKDIDQIIQTTEGDIEVKFNPRRSLTIPRSLSSIPRSLSSRYDNNDFHTAPSNMSRASSSQIKEELESVENIIISENKIPQGIYSQHTTSRTSPTQSEISYHLPQQ